MPTRCKYLTQSELARFFAEISSRRDRALFSAIYHYGLRVSEATRIKLSDIDFDRQTIYIFRLKNGISGVKPLGDPLASVIRRYLAVRLPTGDGLFTGRQGNLNRHRIAQLFKLYATGAGLCGFSVHSLRHSIATHMREAGFGLEDVKDHLGHQKIESTYIYAHITPRGLAKVFRRIEKSPSIVKIV